jgi:hypothetical protein
VIQYLDADDLLAPDKIERQMPLLGEGVLCSGEWVPFFEYPERGRFVPSELCQDLEPVAWLVTAWSSGLMMQPAAWLLERDLALRVGPWDERLSVDDDGEYFARVILASRSVRFCPGARVFYRVGNTGSLSWGASPRAIRSGYLAAMLSTDHLLRAERSPRTARAAAERLMFFVYTTYPKAPDLVRDAEERIRALGVEMPRPRGGPLFRTVSSVIGWKAAKSLRQPYYLAKLAVARAVERIRTSASWRR